MQHAGVVFPEARVPPLRRRGKRNRLHLPSVVVLGAPVVALLWHRAVLARAGNKTGALSGDEVWWLCAAYTQHRARESAWSTGPSPQLECGLVTVYRPVLFRPLFFFFPFPTIL